MTEQLKAAIEAVEASNTPKTPDAPASAPEDDTVVPAAQADDNEGEDDDTDATAASDGTDAPARPKNKGVGKRINELTKDKHEAIRERDYWRQEAERLRTQRSSATEAQPTQAAPPSDGKPTLEAFDFDQSAYLEALADWKLAERDRAASTVKRQQTFKEKELAFIAEHPDYLDVVRAPYVPITQDVAEVIYETDNPPAIAYYLAQHLDEAAEIAGMAPIPMARAIGKIEAALTRAQDAPAPQVPSPPKTVTSAPAVASNVAARSPVVKPVAAMTVEDHIEKLRVKSGR